MDRYISQMQGGKLIDADNTFTVKEQHARQKLLESIPTDRSFGFLYLYEQALWHLERAPQYITLGTLSEGYHPFWLDLSHLPAELSLSLTKELRAPFGPDSPSSILAKAILRSLPFSKTVQVNWRTDNVKPNIRMLPRGGFTLRQEDPSVPDVLKRPTSGPVIFCQFQADVADYHRKSMATQHRFYYRLIEGKESILPLRSPYRKVGSFFNYRSQPFTAIRSHARLPDTSPDMCHFHSDLKEGAYSYLDPQTLLLDKREPARFLFLSWRPNYGNPTFIHHDISTELNFGKRDYDALFFVDTSECAPHVRFLSDRAITPTVPIKGPPGLSGLVYWPSLKRDLWGTKLVTDDNYNEAISWVQEQADATCRVLSEHLDQVIERVQDSRLLKPSYQDDTIAKIRSYWGGL